jgi:hypothetical protein
MSADGIRIFLLLIIVTAESCISFSMAASSEECGVSSYNPPHPALTTTMNSAGRRLQVSLIKLPSQ